MKGWRPRISVEITEEQYKRKTRLIPWGQETRIMRTLLDGLLELLEDPDARMSIIANILSKNITARHILKIEGVNELKNHKA